MFEREEGGFKARGDAELVEDVVDVVFDGANADTEFAGDVGIAIACGDERQNTVFLLRKLVEDVKHDRDPFSIYIGICWAITVGGSRRSVRRDVKGYVSLARVTAAALQ